MHFEGEEDMRIYEKLYLSTFFYIQSSLEFLTSLNMTTITKIL